MKGFSGGMSELMKQANQMQLKMKKMQDELSKKTYEGTAGGGAVTVTVDGDHYLKSLKVDPEVLKSGDTDMLQDMLIAATNAAIKTAKETSDKEMSKITGGMGIPGMF